MNTEPAIQTSPKPKTSERIFDLTMVILQVVKQNAKIVFLQLINKPGKSRNDKKSYKAWKRLSV